ncbi:hypothetical protein RJ641_002228, partial [Dillenia turbinata]
MGIFLESSSAKAREKKKGVDLFSDLSYLVDQIYSVLDNVARWVPDMPIGWPLGLGNMNMRLAVVESLQVAGDPDLSLHARSTSFSSVSLGRLIGIRPGNGGKLYFSNAIRIEEEHERKTVSNLLNSEVSRDRKSEMAQGICIPLLLGILVKLSR